MSEHKFWKNEEPVLTVPFSKAWSEEAREAASSSRGKKMSAFEGGRATAGITQKHKPLIWEAMLGTVNARSPEGHIKNFDYDYEGAHAHAQSQGHSDLRIAKAPQTYNWRGRGTPEDSVSGGPRKGQTALWGIPDPSMPEPRP